MEPDGRHDSQKPRCNSPKRKDGSGFGRAVFSRRNAPPSALVGLELLLVVAIEALAAVAAAEARHLVVAIAPDVPAIVTVAQPYGSVPRRIARSPPGAREGCPSVA
jgi:hypothetical protein